MELNQMTKGTITTKARPDTFVTWDRASETAYVRRDGLIIDRRKIKGSDPISKFYDYIQEYKLN